MERSQRKGLPLLLPAEAFFLKTETHLSVVVMVFEKETGGCENNCGRCELLARALLFDSGSHPVSTEKRNNHIFHRCWFNAFFKGFTCVSVLEKLEQGSPAHV